MRLRSSLHCPLGQDIRRQHSHSGHNTSVDLCIIIQTKQKYENYAHKSVSKSIEYQYQESIQLDSPSRTQNGKGAKIIIQRHKGMS